jgi:hypothetical protein
MSRNKISLSQIIKSWSLFLRNLSQEPLPALTSLLCALVTNGEISGKTSFHQRFAQFKVWPHTGWIQTWWGFVRKALKSWFIDGTARSIRSGTVRFSSTHISFWAKSLALLVYFPSLYIRFIKERDDRSSKRSYLSLVPPETRDSFPHLEVFSSYSLGAFRKL